MTLKSLHPRCALFASLTVRGIAEGTLEEQIFCRYLAQDVFFLDSFARAYALAIARSRSQQPFKVNPWLLLPEELDFRRNTGMGGKFR
jgi:TENA/THI-4/PQQC family